MNTPHTLGHIGWSPDYKSTPKLPAIGNLQPVDQRRIVRSLPVTTGFFWWRETSNDEWRVIHVISHELDGAVTNPDYLSTYDVHHHRWSGRSMRCWREYDPIGEWCEILPPNTPDQERKSPASDGSI